MTTFLPKDVQEGLDAARALARKKRARLKLRVGDQSFAILRKWEGGFALDAAEAPNLRGLVDVYDGARHLSRALIVTSEEEAGERRFEYKRMTETCDAQPLDFYKDPKAPVGLLPKG